MTLRMRNISFKMMPNEKFIHINSVLFLTRYSGDGYFKRNIH